jgi:hypothetical protein
MFMKTPFDLSIIQADENKGVTVSPNLASLYRIEVSDFFGNNIYSHSIMICYPQCNGCTPI